MARQHKSLYVRVEFRTPISRICRHSSSGRIRRWIYFLSQFAGGDMAERKLLAAVIVCSLNDVVPASGI
ncbi:hypothetical protein LINPERHAP1_LOCUS9643, partial [Linum perenne]